MAGKDFVLRATPAAAAAIDLLRGSARKSYATFEAELRRQGCGVAGYRLLGAEDGSYDDGDAGFEGSDHAPVINQSLAAELRVAVGRHDSRAFYAELSQTLAIGAAGQGRKEKPACCGKGGWPSVGPPPDERIGRLKSRNV